MGESRRMHGPGPACPMNIFRYSDADIYDRAWMNHIISGTRADGKGPFERPLRKCIANDQRIYQGIIRHVKKCPDCEPELIVHAFLNQRDRRQVDGIGSITFLKFSQSLCQIRSISRDLLQEILIRSGNWRAIDSEWDTLSIRDKIRACHFCMRGYSHVEQVKFFDKFWPMLPMHTDEELQNATVIWEVHHR